MSEHTRITEDDWRQACIRKDEEVDRLQARIEVLEGALREYVYKDESGVWERRLPPLQAQARANRMAAFLLSDTQPPPALTPDQYPDLSPEMRAIFDRNWGIGTRGQEALRYLAKKSSPAPALVEALRFYATRANWIPGFEPGDEGGVFNSAIGRDCGQRARAALAAAPSEGEQEARRG